MINLSAEEWRSIRYALEEFEDSFLWEVIKETLENRRASLLVNLDNPKTPINILNFTQGSRFGLNCGIIIIDSLRKSADRYLKKARSPEDDDG